MPDAVTASDAYARRFAGAAGQYLLQVQEIAVEKAIRARPALPAGTRVLDHAGSHGQLAPLIKREGLERTVSVSCEGIADRADPLASLAAGPLDRLALPDRSFDAVISVRLLAHAQDTEATVREMCRLARHSVIVDYPSRCSLNALSRLLFRIKLRIEGDTRPFVSISDRRLREMFEAQGFREVFSERQFFIPMAIHRAARGNAAVQWLERVARRLGLTQLIGNPVVVRYDRAADE